MLVLLSLLGASLALARVARSLRSPDGPAQPWPYYQDERWLVQRWLLERDRVERGRFERRRIDRDQLHPAHRD